MVQTNVDIKIPKREYKKQAKSDRTVTTEKIETKEQAELLKSCWVNRVSMVRNQAIGR